jgi:4-hydroxysphinganine ceramide fatty acyl 2-hydroxylase
MFSHLRMFVSHVSVWLMGCWLLVFLALIMFHLNTWSAWLAIASGVAFFYISEYTNHRFVFHAPPPRHPFLLKLFRRLHYDHHEYPRDFHLLFLPVWWSAPQLIIAWLVVWAVTGKWWLACALDVGALAALLYYEWTHYVAHQPIIPKTPWGKRMKKYHLWHHYKNEHYWFGVTNPSLDFVGGTYRDVDATELSPTARKLYPTRPDGGSE